MEAQVVFPSVDTDIALFEESEHEIVCDIYAMRVAGTTELPPCTGDPARWVAWRPNCCEASPRYRLVCDHCKKVYQNWIARQAHIYCPACHNETGGFVDFTPLRKGA